MTVVEADYSFSTCITIDENDSETVSEFCYLGDIIGQTGACIDAVIACIQSAWKGFFIYLFIF